MVSGNHDYIVASRCTAHTDDFGPLNGSARLQTMYWLAVIHHAGDSSTPHSVTETIMTVVANRLYQQVHTCDMDV